MNLRQFLTEAKFKVPDSEPLGVKGLEQNDLARAESIGGMTSVMTEFTNQKVSPMPGNRWKLGIKNGELYVIWPPKGKLMLRVRMETNPDYYKSVLSVFKAAYKNYVEKLKK